MTLLPAPKNRFYNNNTISSIIRTKMVLDPTIPDWPTVPDGRKEAMWQLLTRTFILPRETQDKVKHYANKMLGETFCRWKSELNTKYVQKGLAPFADYGDITHNNGKSLFGKRILRNL